MFILGIDPGTGRTGWGIVKKNGTPRLAATTGDMVSSPQPSVKEDSKSTQDNIESSFEYIAHGCIITSQDQTMSQRLYVLHGEVRKLIDTFSPHSVIIESIFFGRNTKTAISVGQARGVIMLAAAYSNLPVFEYNSLSVKHFLSGHGRTDKKEMQKIVRRLLNESKKKLSFNAKDKGFDDAADALAIALYHILKF